MRGGRLKSGLVVPSVVSSVKPPAFVCRVIVGKEEDGSPKMCGKQFTEDEARAWTQHVVSCAKQHEAEIRESSLREKMPGFYGPDAADGELERWVRQHRQEIIEGRLSFVGKRKRYETRRKRR